MFTRIVEEPGRGCRIAPGKQYTEFVVQTRGVERTARAGQSLAVHGAGLTGMAVRAGLLMAGQTS